MDDGGTDTIMWYYRAMSYPVLGSRGSLVVNVLDSWSSCHEFVRSAAEDPLSCDILVITVKNPSPASHDFEPTTAEDSPCIEELMKDLKQSFIMSSYWRGGDVRRGHGHKLVTGDSWNRVLVPLKTLRVVKRVKFVKTKSLHVEMGGRFRD
ncbi:hypothetical protein TNCV_2109731 [Trichonephila clavipes]|nr:hypothetical protein TNCV_2109731 [Trichonephila clavipes]